MPPWQAGQDPQQKHAKARTPRTQKRATSWAFIYCHSEAAEPLETLPMSRKMTTLIKNKNPTALSTCTRHRLAEQGKLETFLPPPGSPGPKNGIHLHMRYHSEAAELLETVQNGRLTLCAKKTRRRPTQKNSAQRLKHAKKLWKPLSHRSLRAADLSFL
ncbi:hypothetical protein BDZ89DRAFT_1214886 [Hymenopellis radicata]|nr:hypothetical protein BDZ89DRAFT_1214886 [Hymenopellis radicata]